MTTRASTHDALATGDMRAWCVNSDNRMPGQKVLGGGDRRLWVLPLDHGTL